MTPDLFAFAAKPDANVERIDPGMSVDRPRSDNAELWNLRLDNPRCSACASVYVRRYAAQRFCSHRCYATSLRVQIEPRFWSHVNKNGPIHPILRTRCWLWTANVVGRGSKNRPTNSKHGQFTYRLEGQPQVHVYAHRYAWELVHGPIPNGLMALHRCDVPPCVYEPHLFLGTQDDNMKDAAAKGRLTVPRTRTLSLNDRLTIYYAPRFRGADVALAHAYGVSKVCISFIRRGRFIGSGVWAGTKAEPVRTTIELDDRSRRRA